MKNDSPEIIGYTSLPARFRNARQTLFYFACLLSFVLWLLWFWLDASAHRNLTAARDYAEVNSYFHGFANGMIFTTACFISLCTLLEGAKIHLGLGLNAQPK
ncbi:MAG: hypothetical protein ACO1QS_01385 [Verrucomicrobiota bacterium]